MKLSIVRRQPEPNPIQACPILFRLIPEVFITNVSWCTRGQGGGGGREGVGEAGGGCLWGMTLIGWLTE